MKRVLFVNICLKNPEVTSAVVVRLQPLQSYVPEGMVLVVVPVASRGLHKKKRASHFYPNLPYPNLRPGTEQGWES